MKNKKNKFPNGFFTKERPTITLKEALKDVIPVEWVEKNRTKESKITKICD